MHTPPPQPPQQYSFTPTPQHPTSPTPATPSSYIVTCSPFHLHKKLHRPPSLSQEPSKTFPPTPSPSLPKDKTTELQNTTDEAATTVFLDNHAWRHGGTFATYPKPHFHTVTHECYAVIRGHSVPRLGVGPLEKSSSSAHEYDHPFVDVELKRGDVISLPAGVAHANTTSAAESERYRYVGVYPAGAPKYDNNFCRVRGDELEALKVTAAGIGVPESDPIFGKGKGKGLYEIRGEVDKERDMESRRGM